MTSLSDQPTYYSAKSEPRGFWCRPSYTPGNGSDGPLTVIDCHATNAGLCDSCLIDFAAILAQLAEEGPYVDGRSILESLAEDVALGRSGAAEAHSVLASALLRGVGLLFNPSEPIAHAARALELMGDLHLTTAAQVAVALADVLYSAAAESALWTVARDVSAAVVRADEVITS